MTCVGNTPLPFIHYTDLQEILGMKTRIIKTIAITTGALGCSLALLLVLRPAPQTQTPFATLAGVSVLELPQAAARLVANTPPAQRAAVAREVVQAVAALSKPGAIPFAVSAICRANPDVAAEVVGTAVRLQPTETLTIAQAAFSAAPAALESIIAAICGEVPQAYAALAVVAADQLPASSQQILHALTTALPVLEPSLEQARTYSGDASMRAVMVKTTELVEARAREAVAQMKRAAVENSLQAQDTETVRSAGPNEALAAPLAAKTAAARPLASLGALADVSKTARAELAALDRNAATGGQIGVAALALSPSPLQPAPRVSPPYTPYNPANSVEFRISDSTVVTPGSARNYSAP